MSRSSFILPAGKALPGIELAILDANGKRLPPGEVGEIATRSGSNMVGYWNLPEATAKTLGGPRAHRGLQDAEDRRFHRRSAAQRLRQDPCAAICATPYWVGKDRQAN
jgi:acyl-CoA synthetase (AMP-forming)/AMP-acid ligase II